MEKISVEIQHDERMHEEDRIRKLIEACGEGSGRSQQEARRTLQSIGAPAVEALIQALLHSGNSTIRWRAAEALGHIRDIRAIEPLIQAMGDRSAAVSWRAIDALVDIGDPAMEALTRALDEGNVDIRWGARRAIQDIRIKQSMEGKRDFYQKVNEATAR